jgi:heptosyltransferase-1
MLLIKPSSLGDVVSALPLLCALRAAYPNAVLDWLVAPAFAAVVTGHDAVNDVIIFDRKGLKNWWRSPRVFRQLQALRRRLRDAKYDIVLDAQGLLRSGYFAWITRAPVRIGFADAREGAALAYTKRVPIRRHEALSVTRMLALLDPLHLPIPKAPQFRLPLQPDATAWAERNISAGGIIVVPGCRGAGKRWSTAGFSGVLAALYEHPAVIVGTPDERQIGDVVATGAKRAVLNLAGQTTLPQMIAALARASLVVSNDTGPLHVAAALGVPVIGLYGRTDPAAYGPFGQLDHTIRFAADQLPDQPADPHVVNAVIALARQLLESHQTISTAPSVAHQAVSS